MIDYAIKGNKGIKEKKENNNKNNKKKKKIKTKVKKQEAIFCSERESVSERIYL